jgi:hypothetical protein
MSHRLVGLGSYICGLHGIRIHGNTDSRTYALTASHPYTYGCANAYAYTHGLESS